MNFTATSINYLECRSQTGFNLSKQLQIENFIKTYEIDVLHLQEVHFDDETFTQCRFISSSYTIIKNNSNTKYGTGSLIRNNFQVEDIVLHHSGRIILFNIENVTFGNIYLPSGTEGRPGRETFCSEILPTLLTNSQHSGIVGGDWNCIVDKKDCTRFPETKMSPCLKRLVNAFSWRDSYRAVHPDGSCFSHFYISNGPGATRIDRSYYYGELRPGEAQYVAFSDHHAHIVRVETPTQFQKLISPKYRHLFKISPEIATDKGFQARLANNMQEWQQVKEFGVPVLTWWEVLVKPGIKKLAIERSKELNKERNSNLNLLMLRQSYLSRRVQEGVTDYLTPLREVQLRIEDWYSKKVERVKHQARVDDIQISEKVRLYHHELHRKRIQRSSILKLITDRGVIEGHKDCFNYLQGTVEELLSNPALLDPVCQQILLAEVEPKFTEKDNSMLVAAPTKEEVEESVKTSNIHAAPGSDGITSLVYRECFNILGDALTEVVKMIHDGQQPTRSQRTSMMLFSSKPGKSSSLKPQDKRRLSLLNSDFKILTGVELGRYNKVLTHTLSPHQLAAGDDRRISFGICKARDAIYAASRSKTGCGIADNDFEAAFDFLCLHWVKLVLEKKGLASEALDRFSNIYSDGITVPVINNIPGKAINNKRLSLRQGDRPSGVWFCYGIDPLLTYLEKRLQGILIYSLPVHGPVLHGQGGLLPPLETRYKVEGYLDDCKPAITSMAEFQLVDTACNLFEKSSGCKLHRNPDSNKCKFMALGRWKGTLQQEDIPLPYLRLTDHLDYLGCVLYADYSKTRRENGETLQKRVKDQVNSWKSGKFLPLSSRPWSLNSYCLSKLWYRTGCIDLRIGDSDTITSSIKSWLYQDMLLKPQEMVLYRPLHLGGLGLHNVKQRAKAMLIHTFIAQAVSPQFSTNYYYNSLYRWFILDQHDIPEPIRPPYYSENFFSFLKHIKNTTPLNIVHLSVKQWYQILLEQGVTHTSDNVDAPPMLIKTKLEEGFPILDCPRSYRLSRTFGLDPDQKSFLFKMLQFLLPTKERLHRIGKIQSPACIFCDGLEDTMGHLISCQQGLEVTVPLLNCMKDQDNSVVAGDLTTLSINTTEAMELPATWLIATCLGYVWQERMAGRIARLIACRAELLAKLALLKSTKWKHYTLHNSAVLLDEIINLHFC